MLLDNRSRLLRKTEGRNPDQCKCHHIDRGHHDARNRDHPSAIQASRGLRSSKILACARVGKVNIADIIKTRVFIGDLLFMGLHPLLDNYETPFSQHFNRLPPHLDLSENPFSAFRFTNGFISTPLLVWGITFRRFYRTRENSAFAFF